MTPTDLAQPMSMSVLRRSPRAPADTQVVGRAELVAQLDDAIGSTRTADVAVVRIDVAISGPRRAAEPAPTAPWTGRQLRGMLRRGDVVAELDHHSLAVLLREVSQADARAVTSRLRVELAGAGAESGGAGRVAVTHIHHRLVPGTGAEELLEIAELRARARRSPRLSERVGDGRHGSVCRPADDERA